jgi:hypothetical protein
MRKIGDRVFIVADNFGIGGVIVGLREGIFPYQIRTDDRHTNWYAEYEVFDP